MLSYETALKLKEVGFPQKDNCDRRCPHGEPWEMCCEKPMYVPTLEELIEAFKELEERDIYFISLGYDRNPKGSKLVWGANAESFGFEGHNFFMSDGKTPIEAVAQLYISLNK